MMVAMHRDPGLFSISSAAFYYMFNANFLSAIVGRSRIALDNAVILVITVPLIRLMK